ncbi:MAG: Rieske (2Fe-2S) protein, partial [Beijerinckiaceae bacterium]|nr:Rieske (2Fe-2S) protein [Beijerinckiaceae bacterium]
MAKHVVAAVADLPPGERKRVAAEGRTITVFNVRGEYFALNDRCPHEGGPLCTGKL